MSGGLCFYVFNSSPTVSNILVTFWHLIKTWDTISASKKITKQTKKIILFIVKYKWDHGVLCKGLQSLSIMLDQIGHLKKNWRTIWNYYVNKTLKNHLKYLVWQTNCCGLFENVRSKTTVAFFLYQVLLHSQLILVNRCMLRYKDIPYLNIRKEKRNYFAFCCSCTNPPFLKFSEMPSDCG